MREFPLWFRLLGRPGQVVGMRSFSDRDQQVADAMAQVSTPEGFGVRPFRADDFAVVQAMTTSEGWTTPSERPEQTLSAWMASWPSLVATDDQGTVVGFLRALTDGEITTYIGEIIVAKSQRGAGVGRLLIQVCGQMYPRTRLDILTDSADGFYRAMECREFRGYRVHPAAHG